MYLASIITWLHKYLIWFFTLQIINHSVKLDISWSEEVSGLWNLTNQDRQALKYGEEIDRESELIKKIRSPIRRYCNLSCSFVKIVSARSKKWFWTFVCLKVDNYASSDPISKVFNLLSHLSPALMSNLFSQTSLIFLTKGSNMNYGRNFTFPTLGCCFRTLQHLYER